jgi:hypothetical protein
MGVGLALSPGIAVRGLERREVEERFRKTSLPPSSGPHIKPEKAPDGNADSLMLWFATSSGASRQG